MKLTGKKSLDYNDVNIIAQLGKVESRKQIPIEGWRIMVAGMTSIIGPRFLEALAALPEELQPSIHLVRDVFQEKNLLILEDLGYPKQLVYIGVGLKENLDFEADCVKRGFYNFLIDIANGYLPQIIDKVDSLCSIDEIEKIVCGSVHTTEGFDYLSSNGVDIVRLGIAPGSVCLTKDSTGVTRGTFTEVGILGNYRTEKKVVTQILADGGFKSTADFCKSFLAGADICMTGSIFAECYESRLHCQEELFYFQQQSDLQVPLGIYYGMASEYGKVAMGKADSVTHIEGTYKQYKANKTVEDVLYSLWDGIRSCVSYSGHSTLAEAIGNGVFEVIHK